jgi:hypothetical protein
MNSSQIHIDSSKAYDAVRQHDKIHEPCRWRTGDTWGDIFSRRDKCTKRACLLAVYYKALDNFTDERSKEWEAEQAAKAKEQAEKLERVEDVNAKADAQDDRVVDQREPS